MQKSMFGEKGMDWTEKREGDEGGDGVLSWVSYELWERVGSVGEVVIRVKWYLSEGMQSQMAMRNILYE